MPQLRRARRCLQFALETNAAVENRVHTIDEGVQDRHGAVGDTSIWVDLLQYCNLRQLVFLRVSEIMLAMTRRFDILDAVGCAFVTRPDV
jgi:hypothetical protein